MVLDLGCGSGILSLIAARAGATVYAVDRSAIIEQAREAARRNGLAARIQFTREDLTTFRLRERVDLIVHELIGGAFWDEGLMQIVPRARDRFLKRDGRLIPWRIDVLGAPSRHVSSLESSLRFWSRRRYGFDFGHFGPLAFRQHLAESRHPFGIELRGDASFLAGPRLVHQVDLRRDSRLPEGAETSFDLKRGARFTGVCLFVRVHLDRRRSFSTDPRARPTHWRQLFLPAFEPRTLARDARLRATIFPAERARDWRWNFELV